jgi:hypothetical protein
MTTGEPVSSVVNAELKVKEYFKKERKSAKLFGLLRCDFVIIELLSQAICQAKQKRHCFNPVVESI